MDGLNGAQDGRRLRVLEEVAARSGAQGRHEVVLGRERGDRQDPDRGVGVLDPACGLHPVHQGHLHVHQDHVRLDGGARLHGFDAVGDHTHAGHAGGRVDEHAERAAHERLVVGDQDAQLFGHARQRNRCCGACHLVGVGARPGCPPAVICAMPRRGLCAACTICDGRHTYWGHEDSRSPRFRSPARLHPRRRSGRRRLGGLGRGRRRHDPGPRQRHCGVDVPPLRHLVRLTPGRSAPDA